MSGADLKGDLPSGSGGGAAHLVNPYIVDEIKAGMLKILHDDDYRQQLIRSRI